MGLAGETRDARRETREGTDATKEAEDERPIGSSMTNVTLDVTRMVEGWKGAKTRGDEDVEGDDVFVARVVEVANVDVRFESGARDGTAEDEVGAGEEFVDGEGAGGVVVEEVEDAAEGGTVVFEETLGARDVGEEVAPRVVVQLDVPAAGGARVRDLNGIARRIARGRRT